MTADLHDFIIKTLPGVMGSFFYSLTQQNWVAWLTGVWVFIQIFFFLLDRIRGQKTYLAKKNNA
jgi:hypothetical protein